MMAKAIQLFQAGFNFLQDITRMLEVFWCHLAESGQQIIKCFGVVNESCERAIAQDEVVNGLTPCDPPLMMFHVPEKRFQIIIGGRHIRNVVTSE
jgi:hypothetical protein